MSYSEQLASWSSSLAFEDLPDHVIGNTRLRLLDVIGLALAGSTTPFGRSVVQSVADLADGGCCHVLGTGLASTVTQAAFANGALSQALEFDDTHNRSIVHMSGPSVAAALALAEKNALSGKDVITAIALGNEISCRLGSVAPQQFHRRGFHPTGLFATFGVTSLAAWLLNCDVRETTNATGIAGSFASGLLQCWVDGTQSKFLHPGWAAQSGIQAATLGMNNATGPLEVIEGRFGLLASHLQDDSIELDYDILTDKLGEHWESENASFKPYPLAHVIHPYIDALLRLVAEKNITANDVVSIRCPVPEYIVGIVCKPRSEKRRPQSDSHGRVSLQFTLAEALVLGKIDRHSYTAAALADPAIHAIADKVDYVVDDSFPGPEQFKGEVSITLKDGNTYTQTEEYNRGSKENPMTEDEIIEKFLINSADSLSPARQHKLIDRVLSFEALDKAGDIIQDTFD